MPINDFTSKLLEMEDILVNDISSSDTELHIFFSLKRKPHVCPHCSSITEQIHDYRTSVIKDLPLMGNTLSFITENADTIALVAINIFMKPSTSCPNIAESLHDWHSMPFIC